MNDIPKPKPLKVFGRTHYACLRCKLNKTKCSGQKPCSNCKSANKANDCVYITKDRKIVIMESELNGLYKKIEDLEDSFQSGNRRNMESSAEPFNYEEKYDFSLTMSNASINMSSIEALYKSPNPSNVNFTELSLENFLLPNFQNELLQGNLLETCRRVLPEKQWALKSANTVYRIYSSEFYLMDIKEFLILIDRVYDFFNNRDAYHTYFIRGDETMINRRSLCYFFVVIAFGEQLLNSSPNASPTVPKVPGIEFYLISSQLFDLTREELDFQFIQCASFLALYSANLNRSNTVYNYFGVAIRSALAKSFHRQKSLLSLNPSPSVEQLIYGEKLKRLFWTVFIIETTWSTYRMSLPVHIEYTDTDIDLPCENSYDLGDHFNNQLLEVNVYLAKYIAKFIKLIYGPTMRTFTINYINTDQFNKRSLVRKILYSLNDLVRNFEEPYLVQYTGTQLINPWNRNLANLFMRYHQLLIITTKPLLNLIFNEDLSSVIENPYEVQLAISKGVSASFLTISILLQLYEHKKLFELGFWDSQHLFSAIVFLILASLTGKKYEELHKAIALLKFMSDKNNINACSCLQNLVKLKETLRNVPEVDLFLDLNISMESFAFCNSINAGHDLGCSLKQLSQSSENPYQEFELFNSNSDRVGDSESDIAGAFFIHSTASHEALRSIINTIQSWDDYKK